MTLYCYTNIDQLIFVLLKIHKYSTNYKYVTITNIITNIIGQRCLCYYTLQANTILDIPYQYLSCVLSQVFVLDVQVPLKNVKTVRVKVFATDVQVPLKNVKTIRVKKTSATEVKTKKPVCENSWWAGVVYSVRLKKGKKACKRKCLMTISVKGQWKWTHSALLDDRMCPNQYTSYLTRQI